jgi:hypothetical protein
MSGVTPLRPYEFLSWHASSVQITVTIIHSDLISVQTDYLTQNFRGIPQYVQANVGAVRCLQRE